MRSLRTPILLLGGATAAAGQVVISEVADKGSPDACSGFDWIELHNAGDALAVLDGHVLHDERGPTDLETYSFPADSTLAAGEFLLLCAGTTGDDGPAFGIGGSDQITLRDADGIVVSSTGSALDGTGDYGVALALDEATGAYAYTSTPTPGDANVITALLTPAQIQEALQAQNDAGTDFFNMDQYGMPVEGGLPAVLDLRMTMDESEHAKIIGPERAYEMYSPFVSATFTAVDDPATVYHEATGPGRIRPKGQSTMYIGVCANKTTPYQIEWAGEDDATRTVFGMEKTILRSGFSDPSYVREWAGHRMLARFGLPHLRTRTVRLFINDAYVGLYQAMEAPDQEYVFKRSFPDYDPDNFGLYKVKTMSVGCGNFNDIDLMRAKKRLNETAPYMFDRGDHRPPIPVMGDLFQCLGPFINQIFTLEAQDVQLAYLRSGGDKCGKFLVDVGLVDRDLGKKALEGEAATFVDDHLADNTCDVGCANSNLAEDVDVTQFLRNLATQAVMLNQDSPIGNGNNWYLAWTGDGKWSMVQYDINNIMSSTSGDLCDMAGSCKENLMKWSITRPTCHGLETNQIAGPLLLDDTLRAQYIEHVRDFVDNVATDDLLGVIEDHLAALKDFIMEDPWGDAAFLFEMLEMAEGENWNVPFGDLQYVPFLPAMRARVSELKEQLAAIDDGTYPRSVNEVNLGETCTDWTVGDTPEFLCHNNCYYQGCSTTAVLGSAPVCDPESKMCFLSAIDPGCLGVPNGEPMPGLPDDAAPTFCLTEMGFPSRLTPCPPPPADPEDAGELGEVDEIPDEGENEQDVELPGDGEGAGDVDSPEVSVKEDGSTSSAHGRTSASTLGPCLHIIIGALLLYVGH